MNIRTIAGALLLSMLGTPCFTQTPDNILHGLGRIDVTIEDLNEQAKACRINETTILDSIRYYLSSSRLIIDDKKVGDANLYVTSTRLE